MHQGTEMTQVIKNIWFPEQQQIQCLCPTAISKLQQNKNISQCYRCYKNFHSDCYWAAKEDEQYECPFCYLKYCFPNKPVNCILFGGYLPIMKRNKIQYKIDFAFGPKTHADSGTYLQARCIKFNQANRYQISWPDKSELRLNKSKIQAFQPLPKNSSYKRRADQPVKLRFNLLKQMNQLAIVQQSVSQSRNKIDKKCHYLVAIMSISEQSRTQIMDRFEKSTRNTLPAEVYKRQVQQHMKSVNGVAINKMLISLKCPIYGNRISTPIRSRFCNKHLQPFDMSNFISYSILSSGAVKQWKCPICGKRSYDLLIDLYVQNLLKEHSKIKEIVFGEGLDDEIVDGSESDDVSLSQQRFTSVKPVEKNPKRIRNSASRIQLDSNSEHFDQKLDAVHRESGGFQKNKVSIKQYLPKKKNLLKKKRKTSSKQPSKNSFPIQKFVQTIEISSDEEDHSLFVRTLRNRKKYYVIRTTPIKENNKFIEQKADFPNVGIHQQYCEISSVQGRNEEQSTILPSSGKGQGEKQKCFQQNDEPPKQITVINLDSEQSNFEAADPMDELKDKLNLHAKSFIDQTKIDIDSEDLSTFEEIMNKVLVDQKKMFLHQFG